MAAKTDIYLRFLQHKSLCVFNQSVRTALNKHERLKSSTATIYPSGLRRKSLKYVCWQTSNNCRVYTVICHHHPLPFSFLPPFSIDGLKSLYHIYFICSLIHLKPCLFSNKGKWRGFFSLWWCGVFFGFLLFGGALFHFILLGFWGVLWVFLQVLLVWRWGAWGKGAFKTCLLGLLIKG